MSAKTKIVVLHMKELIMVGALALFAILLIVLFVTFSDQKSKPEEAPSETTETMAYTPGIYTSNVKLSDSVIEVQVTVDADHINSIELVNLDETVETMYPLVTPVLNDLSAQILEKQSIEGITYNPDNQYTSVVLYNAIVAALEKATVSD